MYFSSRALIRSSIDIFVGDVKPGELEVNLELFPVVDKVKLSVVSADPLPESKISLTLSLKLIGFDFVLAEVLVLEYNLSIWLLYVVSPGVEEVKLEDNNVDDKDEEDNEQDVVVVVDVVVEMVEEKEENEEKEEVVVGVVTLESVLDSVLLVRSLFGT